MALALFASCQPGAHAQEASPDGSENIQQDLQRIAAVLNDESLAQAQRDEAARRLISRQSAPARQILRATLVDVSRRGGQLAVARALVADPSPDPQFITPLFALLGPDRNLTEAAAQALANFKNEEQVLTQLINFAGARQTHREVARAAAVRAIGSFPERRAAEALLAMLSKPDESATIRNAAADALIDLTGLRENGRDATKWQAWWAQSVAKPEDQWKLELLSLRAARFDRLQFRHNQLTADLRALLLDQYRDTPEPQRPPLLLRYLSSSEPAVRAVGARIVRDDRTENRTIVAEAKELLRGLTGDSDAEVRLEVALALRAVNDPAALDALLTQLAQEPEADVRAALAMALAPIRDLRAVPQLLALLGDPSDRVAEAAADALKELTPLLAEKDAPLAARALRELRALLLGRGAAPGMTGLREACVEALAGLRDPNLLKAFSDLLRPIESIRVRRSALKGLGELRNPEAAGTIITNALDDAEASVRLEAVIALGKTATFGDAEALYKRLDPSIEPDSSVRDRVWQVLESLFPQAPADRLAFWPDRFKNEPQRRVVALKALADKLVETRATDQLAIVRQQIGETLMQLNQPGEAAPFFRQALEFWRSKRVEDMVTEGLVDQFMEALLRSKQYPEAVEFAAGQIALHESNKQTMGVKIRTEAERLRDAGELQGALTLIAEARKMQPPLDSRYAGDLKIIEQQVRAKLREGSIGPSGNTRSITESLERKVKTSSPWSL